MPQKTNLNINPYFDDFSKDDNFYKVLFKPGFPVQARELTTLQSILQNQIESFGSHMFKEGSMVIPGNIAYDSEYPAVKLNGDHLGINISVYGKELVGKRLKGQTSGIVAKVDRYENVSGDITSPTIFVKYLESGDNNEVQPFQDGEVLITEDSFTYGNTSISAGETVASLISEDATSVGSSASIGAGVYFIRGTFVDVSEDKIFLDPYSNTPSYRVGLTIIEEVVTAKDDDSLYDNAKGFSNFAAPGADRLKISLSLSKKLLTDNDDKTFVELLRVDGGEIKKLQDKSNYNLIRDYFAKRTFEESGNYAIDNFDIEVRESLNDRLGNEGVYFSDQSTNQGSTPDESLMAVSVSPGKAYVKGYDVENQSTAIIDVKKPRDTRTLTNSLVPFEMGTLLRVNNVQGTPLFGVNNNSNIVKLQNQRRGTSATAATGTEIGQARVYNFSLTDSAQVDLSTSWDLYLFDVQTYTTITLNENTLTADMPVSSYIRGVSSGASGYVQSAPGGSTGVTLMQTSGTFIAGEQILINESTELSRSITSVTTYTIEDVKSVYQDSTTLNSELKRDFIADSVLERKLPTGFGIADTVRITTSGAMTCPGKFFNNIKVGDIIRYQIVGVSDETFNRVSAVNAAKTELTLVAEQDRSNVCDGSLPASNFTGTFTIGAPVVRERGGLFAPLEEQNVSSVDLGSSNLLVSSQIREQSTSATGSLSINISATGISSCLFEAFDQERYSVHYNDGSIETLTKDQVTLSSAGKVVSFTGLTASQSSNVTVNTTVKKIGISNKDKVFTRSTKVEVTKSSTGVSTSISQTSKSDFYGTRIQDREISLNVPDVAEVIAVYESLGTSIPTLDSLEFPAGLALNTASILGERVVGSTSKAIAQVVTRSSATKVEIVYLTEDKFTVGENVTFEESNIIAPLQVIGLGNYQDVTNNYTLDTGVKDQFYDYSRIVRRENISYVPSRKLLIIYNHYTVPSNDTGDVYTVNSYDAEQFKDYIPRAGNLRASDVLDFRPRVSNFTSTTLSPFDYTSRTFATAGTNPTLLVAPDESSLVGFSYYLPRIDKVVFTTKGNIAVIEGTSSENPKEPAIGGDMMELGTIVLPAYLYNPSDAVITLTDNRRYTMRDIGRIEDRVETLETLTSLSLLELDTRTLQVRDADGLDRFKSGFFVDDFADNLRMESKSEASIRGNELGTPVDYFSLKPEVATSEGSTQFDLNSDLLDPNTQKTGDLITLKYDTKGWIKQPLASRVENVNPFNIISFTGSVAIFPAQDSWTRTVTIDGGERVTRVSTDWRNGQQGRVSNLDVVLESRTPDTHIRSRNVAFSAFGLRPLTRHYHFFDSSTELDVIPKLTEITMTSGVFQAGETVKGYVGSRQLFSARICRPNHLDGPITNPSKTYTLNPYNRSITLPEVYSASSTVLNIDLHSLMEEVLGSFNGRIVKDMVILGETSGAQAKVSDIRLITDTFGGILGCFFFRDPLASPTPAVRFTTGEKTFKLTSSSTNAEPLPGGLRFSTGEGTYTARGFIETSRRTLNVTEFFRRPRPPVQRRDPLAQSFTVDETGAFLTSLDVFFANKDENEKITCEIRTMELGIPTNILVADYAQVTLDPSEINTSTDGSVATTFTFPSPVYLEADTEYCFVLLAPSSDLYEVWVARMGEKTVNVSTLPDAESVIVTKQYIGGSLFKSQNGTIWTASQFEDIKFELYKAEFNTEPGIAYFFNPSLESGSDLTERLITNPVKTLPRKLKVGITTTSVLDTVLTIGKKVSDNTSSSAITGNIEQVGGNLANTTSNLVGAGYSNGTFTGVNFYSITGSGSGAIGIVTFASNTLNGNPHVTTAGNGYVVGDVLGITTSDVTRGRGAQFSVKNITGKDTLYLTDVQGEEFTAGQNLVVYSSSDVAVAYADTTIRNSSVISNLYDGRVLEIQQTNHGLHADNNVVVLADIEPNTVPTTLNAALGLSDTTISVANTSLFATFEGISTSSGYCKVNNEIIYYNSITAGSGGAGTLGIGTRGIDNSLKRAHDLNDQIFTYELNGISLHRINTQHNIPTDSTLKNARDFDTYHLQIDRGSRTTGDNQLSFTDENTVGGPVVFSSSDIQFNEINPRLNVFTPSESTTLNSQIRTVSGTSAGGSEVSFIDQGYENVSLNNDNKLSTPRMVASRINETTRLTSLPNNKSLTLAISMSTADSNLSPVIDLQGSGIILGRNRLNNPISDYANDGRVNSLKEDPHTAYYISKKTDLAQPATSLKVIVAAYRHSSADFRVLYELFRVDSNGIEQSFELFPGFDNLKDTNGDGFGDEVVDSVLNNGRPDAFVRSSADDEYIDYQFSADNLAQFNGFRIKIVMSGTNEAKAPRFKDFRVIALA
tara:strand:+ start:13144 stop:20211 length:7068 start_codon:yes stop_codon:yes gene_type:complete